jgi:N-acetyltransferase
VIQYSFDAYYKYMFDPHTPLVPQTVVLSNHVVTLEPIAHKHTDAIVEALDDSVFAYMPMRSSIRTKNEVRRYIDFQLSRPSTIVFAVIENTSGKAIGSTSYMNIRPDHRGLEIGSTWIAKHARGTKVNPSMKYLMLKHAFEELGAIRVELKTDARNTQSRAAILKLGAHFEGILRQHIIMPDGHLRDSAMYSIIPDQWEDVSTTLLTRING